MFHFFKFFSRRTLTLFEENFHFFSQKERIVYYSARGERQRVQTSVKLYHTSRSRCVSSCDVYNLSWPLFRKFGLTMAVWRTNAAAFSPSIVKSRPSIESRIFDRDVMKMLFEGVHVFFKRTLTFFEKIFTFFSRRTLTFFENIFTFFSRRTLTSFGDIFHLKASLKVFLHRKIAEVNFLSWISTKCNFQRWMWTVRIGGPSLLIIRNACENKMENDPTSCTYY